MSGRYSECEPGGACQTGVLGAAWIRRYGFQDPAEDFATAELFLVTFLQGMGTVTGYGGGMLAQAPQPTPF